MTMNEMEQAKMTHWLYKNKLVLSIVSAAVALYLLHGNKRSTLIAIVIGILVYFGVNFYTDKSAKDLIAMKDNYSSHIVDATPPIEMEEYALATFSPANKDNTQVYSGGLKGDIEAYTKASVPYGPITSTFKGVQPEDVKYQLY